MSTIANRINSGIATAKQWESDLEDKTFLAQVRELIPFQVLCPEITRHTSIKEQATADTAVPENPFYAVDDYLYEGDDLLLKRLTLFFQKRFMKWVNNPPCRFCGSKETTCHGVRGAETPEERDGQASRVEIYFCPTCDGLTTTFPRYNSPRKLLQTREGRCGEFANLFGFLCRAVGFETRYVLDFTDHVWVEVWSHRQQRWIMADSCEGKIDAPSMYEKGWGKKLSYILGFTMDSVMDITKRYTRVFDSTEFLERRRLICPSEYESDSMIDQFNATLRKQGKLSKSLEEMERREQDEKRFLDYTTRSNWELDSYNDGRVSGSLAWRIARGEVGKKKDEANAEVNNTPGSNKITSSFSHSRSSAIGSTKAIEIETFSPSLSENFEVVVRARPLNAPRCFPECLVINGVSCGAGLEASINIVVIDQTNACVLLSRMFSSWSEAASFLSFIPDGRVVALVSDVLVEESEEMFVKTHVQRLIGLSDDSLSSHKSSPDKTLLSVGQMNMSVEWAFCRLVDPGISTKVSLRTTKSQNMEDLQLTTESGIVPPIVVGRIPDHIMPLEEQIKADDKKKRQAFLSFISSDNSDEKYVGFTSKRGLPIYLLNNKCFPLKRCPNDSLFASEWHTSYYVPKALVKNDVASVATFDIPVNEPLFSSIVGPTILRKDEIRATSEALLNKRLIAFYFSAHWCPPCRQFTPILCEFYDHLNESMPTALEIIFISSDRDSSSYASYYSQMPWLAVPYENVKYIQHALSSRFAISGIPAFVVLDSLSGDIVVTAEKGRAEVATACRFGINAIENLVQRWIDSTSEETQMIIDALQISSLEINVDVHDDRRHDYLFAKVTTASQCLDPHCTVSELDLSVPYQEEELITCKDLLIKYIDNARRDPSCTKYRTIRLSNKIFDRVTSSTNGIDYILQNGFAIYFTETDYIASIPLTSDFEQMISDISHK